MVARWESKIWPSKRSAYNPAVAKARRKPEIVVRDGSPAAVILDIDEYRELLERVEDLEDLRALEKMRQGPIRFASLDDFLRKQRPSA